jgi:hypothetical protein
MAEPPNILGNLVILAADRPLEPAEEPAAPTSRWSAQYNLVHAWDNRFAVADADPVILTDDLNPSDLWANRVNVAARADLHEFFGRGGVDR